MRGAGGLRASPGPRGARPGEQRHPRGSRSAQLPLRSRGCSGCSGIFRGARDVQECSGMLRCRGSAGPLPEVGPGERFPGSCWARGSRPGIPGACGASAAGARRDAVRGTPEPGGHLWPRLKSVPRGAECPGRRLCSGGELGGCWMRLPLPLGRGSSAGLRGKLRGTGIYFLSRKLRTMETGLGSQEASLPTVGFLCQSSETVNTKYRKSSGLGETVGKM